jgi:hypothetical protein
LSRVEQVKSVIRAVLHRALCLYCLWGIPGLPQVREDVVDSFESIIQVFGGAAAAEELVAICVLDEEVACATSLRRSVTSWSRESAPPFVANPQVCQQASTLVTMVSSVENCA